MIIEVNVVKANHVATFDTEKLPPASIEYALRYGLTQCIVDTTAGVKRDNFQTDELFHAEALKRAQKRIDQLNSGEVPTMRKPGDPTKAAATKLAAKLLEAGLDEAALVEFIESRKTTTGDSTQAVAADSKLIPAPKKSKKAA